LAAKGSTGWEAEVGRSVELIHDDVARIALDRVEGFAFERFASACYSSLVGVTFVPLGGVKAGGADGYEGTIYEDGSRSGAYYQRAQRLT